MADHLKLMFPVSRVVDLAAVAVVVDLAADAVVAEADTNTI